MVALDGPYYPQKASCGGWVRSPHVRCRFSKLTLCSYLVVVVSNQAGLAIKGDPKAPKAHQLRVPAFKSKVNAVFSQLDIPITIYAATEKDIYRKPRVGMWKEFLEDYDFEGPEDIDMGESFFVGDAGGRIAGAGFPRDFSSSDRYVQRFNKKSAQSMLNSISGFAENIGLKYYTPEEYFLKAAPRPFLRNFEPSAHARTSEDESGDGMCFGK
jgi:bifunctional polynucleotide phosphatase/kinase